MNIRVIFALSAFLLLNSALAVRNTAQTPLPPGTDGTYYYGGFDSANSRYVYVSSSGTYFYVDTGGVTTIGPEVELPFASPYRAIVTGGTFSFQFYNNIGSNYALTTVTGTDGTVVTATDFSVRSGTFTASDVTYSLLGSTAGSALWIEGVSGTFSAADLAMFTGSTVTYPDGSARVIYDQPVVFTGTNVNLIAESSDNSSRQALSIRNGGAVYLYGGTISKTVMVAGAGSETIYMVSNQEGLGSSNYFYGEDLTIISTGSALETFNMAAGNNVVKLVNSSITATLHDVSTTNVFVLAGTPELGSNHFYGEGLDISVSGSTNDRVLYLGATGGNTFTLVSSTITADIVGKTNVQDTFYLNATDGGGNGFYGDDLTIINGYGRTFVLGSGSNTITLKNSNITANGAGPVFAWNATSSSSGDEVESTVWLENTNVTNTANYSPIFQQIGDRARITITGGTYATAGEYSPIIRLVAQNDLGDSTRNHIVLKNTVFDAKNASAFDLNIDAGANTLYGQGGGGGKNIGTMVEDYYNIIIQSSTIFGQVAAMRIAAAGTGTSTYTQNTVLFVYDSTFAGGIQMVAGRESFQYNFASGGNLTLTASNSVFDGGMFITGTEAAQRSNQAILYIYDSTWTGDIILTNRGNLTLQFKNTPIDGGLSLSGSSRVQLRLNDSPIIGDISTADTATITGFVSGNGQIGSVSASGGLIDLDLDHAPSGGVAANGTGSIALRIKNEVTIPGDIILSGTSFTAITLQNTARLTTGNLTILERATFALATAQGNITTLGGNVTLAGIWHIPGKTILDGTLNISDPLGTISIGNAGTDSLILANGMTGSGRLAVTSFGSEEIGETGIRLIYDKTGSWAADALILAHPLDNGLVSYGLENRSDGAYLVGGLGSPGAAVINSQALVVEDWYAALAPLNYRLNQLRESNAAVLGGASSYASGDAGSFWFQGRADTTRVDLFGEPLDFTSRVIGMTVGGDTRWDQDTGTFALGAFADTSRTDRDFFGTADGHTTSAGGGVYLHYQHRTGLFTSAVARFDIYETSLNANSPNNDLSADYHSQTGGVAIDIGWRFNLDSQSGWWFEPAYQIAFATFPGISYTTEASETKDPNEIRTTDGRATQSLLRFAFGRRFNERWSFRGHIMAASISASGGAFTSVGGIFTPADFNNSNRTIAESRSEVSLGISRLVGRAGRLNIDVSYTEADVYDRPCSVFFGYTHLW